MKAVTVKQWEKMSARSKSWLVVKALGLWTSVWWHVSLDGSRDQIRSGSYQSEEFAKEVLAYKPNKFPKTARVRRDFGFLEIVDPKGENLNPMQTVIKEMAKREFECHLYFGVGPKKHCASFTELRSRQTFFFDNLNITECVAAAALQMLGFLERYPF